MPFDKLNEVLNVVRMLKEGNHADTCRAFLDRMCLQSATHVFWLDQLLCLHTCLVLISTPARSNFDLSYGTASVQLQRPREGASNIALSLAGM